jgi:EAL domain-containing protein (putative c-di-GMP-specific phosphodiesterase class I)
MQNSEWQKKGLPPIRMAVNISARQFRNGDLTELVERALRRSGLDPCWLELEITESMIMGNVEAAVQTMRELSNMGVQLAIDDFGTGYSSLGRLKRLPINRLKIDRSFVREIPTNPNDAAIAAAIVALSHTLGLEVIAEGIETDEHLALLLKMGCEQGQGYLISRPQPPTLLNSFFPSV